jgi:PAS domain S-box-containing protein
VKDARILIVEDEKIVALDIQNQLKSAGYTVCGVFGSGEEALKNIGEADPHLVLMDIQLQGEMDGVEAAGIIRDRYRIPVVFLTAFADTVTIDRAKIIEPFGYITKPFDERSLRTTIEMALYKSSMDKKLQVSEEKYREFFEEDLSGDFICDAEGNIEDCNSAFVRMFGFPDREQVLGMNIGNLFPGKEERNRFWKNLERHRRLSLSEITFTSPSKGPLSVLANLIAHVKGYLIDITERKELEEQLKHSQKMEAVGRLAGGVAHDFNNILTVILGYITMIREKNQSEEDIEVDIQNLKGAVQRAVKLTKQLLVFSRREVMKPQTVNINTLIQNIEKMIRRLISEEVNMQFFLDAEEPMVYIDPGQLEQVLVNLSVNARDAMPEGGRLVVLTETRSITEPETAVNGVVPPGSYVVIRVSDNGMGIDDDYLTKIFEPFFTTKGNDQGTGLGLSMVYGIIDQSGGYIKVHTETGKGTDFTILLPLKEGKVKLTEPVGPEIGKVEGSERILIVEDEDNLRRLAGRILRRKGYYILEAKNGGEALLICEKTKEPIELLLTDFTLPFINGDELARRIRTELPDIKVIMMSGNPQIEDIPLTEKDGVYAFLQKPFDIDTLYTTVRKVLDGKQDA